MHKAHPHGCAFFVAGGAFFLRKLLQGSLFFYVCRDQQISKIQIMKKVMPYSMHRMILVLGFAGAILFGGCSKDDGPTTPLRDTAVYTFGKKTLSPNWSPEHIKATADSVNIKRIILRSDEKSWGYGASEEQIKDLVIMPLVNAVSPQNQYKVRGEGKLVDIYQKDAAAHTWLENFGFTFYDRSLGY